MKKAQNTPLLLSPGPVAIADSILQTLSEPMIHHRSKEFELVFKQAKGLLKQMFQTQQEVFILNSSGTGAMSAGLLNTLSPGDTVLTLSAGKFGERWAEMAMAYKLKTLTVSAPYGKAVSVQSASALLRKNPQTKAVLAQACETSTGVLHPVRELAGLVREKPNTLFIVDAISALGAVDIPMDEWGIDVMTAGSQKSFCLPAGMSFIALSQKAWRFNESSRLPVYYLDLRKEATAQAKWQTAFSSNVSFIRALRAFLQPLSNKEGLGGMIRHSKELSKITLQFCRTLGLKVFADPPSPSLTCMALPDSIDGVKLKNLLEEKYRVILAGGQGKLKGRIIRVGHLGDVSKPDLKKGLKSLALALQETAPGLFDKKDMEKALTFCK